MKRSENNKSYIRLLNDMLTDRRFEKSEKFLKSVKEYYEKNGFLSYDQKKAINNIFFGVRM